MNRSPASFGASGAIAHHHLPMMLGFSRMGRVGLLVLLGVMAAEMILPGPYKPSSMIGGFFGALDAAELQAKQAAESEYRNRIAEAEAEVERKTMTFEAELRRVNADFEAELIRTNAAYQSKLDWMSGAYQSAYARLETVTAAAVQMEQQYLAALASAQRAGQGGNNVVATGFDLACGFSVFAGDIGSQSKYCGQGEKFRNQNVQEIKRTVTASAGALTQQVMAGLPDPINLGSHLGQVATTATPLFISDADARAR